MYFFTSYFFQPLGLNNNLGILITIILFTIKIKYSIFVFLETWVKENLNIKILKIEIRDKILLILLQILEDYFFFEIRKENEFKNDFELFFVFKESFLEAFTPLVIIFFYFLIKDKKIFLKYLINNKLKVLHFCFLFLIYYLFFLKGVSNTTNFYEYFFSYSRVIKEIKEKYEEEKKKKQNSKKNYRNKTFKKH